MKSTSMSLFVLIAVVTLFTTAYGQQHPVLTFQSFLMDSTGHAAPDGNYTVIFRLYDDPTAGTLRWEETQMVSVDHGLYDVFFGEISPLNIPLDRDYWLSVEIDGQGEMSPRLRVGYALYSIKSLKSDSSYHALNTDSLGNRPADFYTPITSLSFDSITGLASDAQIADNITINSAKNADSLGQRHSSGYLQDTGDSFTGTLSGGIFSGTHTGDGSGLTGISSDNALNADSLGNIVAAAYTTDSELSSHAGVAGAHHTKYIDSEAVSAMGTKGDTNPLHHDKITSLAFSSITGIATDAQVPDDITINSAKKALNADSLGNIVASAYSTDAELSTHSSDGSAHHTSYTDAEAVSAMGTKGDTNPLHHDKTTSLAFSSLTGSALDAQIPDDITINSAKNALNADSLGNVVAAAYATDSELSSHSGVAGAHHTK